MSWFTDDKQYIFGKKNNAINTGTESIKITRGSQPTVMKSKWFLRINDKHFIIIAGAEYNNGFTFNETRSLACAALLDLEKNTLTGIKLGINYNSATCRFFVDQRNGVVIPYFAVSGECIYKYTSEGLTRLNLGINVGSENGLAYVNGGTITINGYTITLDPNGGPRNRLYSTAGSFARLSNYVLGDLQYSNTKLMQSFDGYTYELDGNFIYKTKYQLNNIIEVKQ